VATAVITVTDVNDAPVAVDDAGTTTEDSSIAIQVLANDSDLEGILDPSTLAVVTPPSNGTTAIDTSAGTIIYTPTANYFGSDSFTYVVSDDDGATTNQATVDLTITPVNDPPIVVDDAVGTGEDQAVTIVVLFNDSDVDGTLVPSTVTVVSAPVNGTTSVNAVTGEIRYVPNPNFNGLEAFTYTVGDNNGGISDEATVTVIVTDQNDVPVAADDSTGTNEDTPVVVAVLSNDSDLDGTIDSTTVTVVTPPASGTTSVDPVGGEITYTPVLNFFGTDSFTYTVTDDDIGVSSPGTVIVTVLEINDAPIATNDSTNTGEDTPVAVAVLSNDTDVDGSLDPASVAIVADASNGSASVDLTTGVVTYTPNNNFFGSDTFTYSVADDEGDVSNIANVIITISDDNDPPVASDDTATTPEDTAVTIPVLANDSDLDGTLQSGSVKVVTDVGNGSTTIDPNTGVVTYSPAVDFFGSDSFTYTVTDDDGGVSNVATVTVTVSDVNDSPVAVSDTSGTNEDTPVVIAVLSNDSDVDGSLELASVTIVNDVSDGETSLDTNTGAVTYTPNPNFFGTDSFTYTVADDDSAVSNIASVTISVTDNNDQPVAVNDTTTTDEDTPVVIAVISNDSDLDGTLQPGSVAVVAAPSNGSTSVDASSGAVTYSPSANFFGVDSFTYTVSDDDGGTSNVASVLVNVVDRNDAPVAANDTSGTGEDTAVVIGVLANDSDIDGTLQTTTVQVTTNPGNGSVVVDTTSGAVTYTPNSNFFGTDTFSYTVADDDGATSNAATVTVNVTDNNDLPVAVADTAATSEDSPVVIQVISNDSDVDGTIIPSTVTVIGAPTNGAASAQTDGSVHYTPNTNFFGSDSFTYTVADDDNGTSNVATVTVSVADINDVPVAVDDAPTTSEDNPTTIAVLDNDNDVDGSLQANTVTVVSSPNNGSATVNETTGTITYTPSSNFTGVDSLRYTVADDDGGVSNSATVVISVESVNDAPVAVNDTTSTDEEASVTVSVLTNDNDLDGTLLSTTLTVISGAGNGSTQVDGVGGTITYTPNLDFFGTDTFTYRVSDNTGGTSNEATVMITVNPIDDPPVAADDNATTNEDTPIVIPVAANDVDVDGTIDPSTVTIATIPNNGTVSVDGSTGSVNYTPNLNFFGSDVFTYTVQDLQGITTNTASVTVSVVAVNDAPVAVGDTSFTLENTPVAINVAANDTDVDFNLDFSSITIVTPPINGTTLVNAITGVVTYTPSTDYNGVDSFSYRILDTEGGISNVVSVNLTVHPSTLTFIATEDAYVLSSQASDNFGSSSNLRLRLTATAITLTYLKFDVSGVVGQVVDARVRLTTIDEGDDGGGIVPVSNNYLATSTPWDESGLNFSNAPDAFADPISSVGALALDQVAEYDVTSAITGNGKHSFAIRNQSSNAVHFSSKEGSVAPQLTIQLALPSSTDPTLLTFSPTSGGIGTEVTITGINLSSIHTVSFNGTNTGNFNVVSDNQILAVVPSGATIGKI
ncbi:tandem-95 repeat protein, partial [bacterium]|nr:tandem-95 repeat protein [bacterium]